jgi:hypothetical protein
MPLRCLSKACQKACRCPSYVSQMAPRCLPDASQMPPRPFPDASQMHPRNSAPQWLLHGFMDFSSMIHQTTCLGSHGGVIFVRYNLSPSSSSSVEPVSFIFSVCVLLNYSLSAPGQFLIKHNCRC